MRKCTRILAAILAVLSLGAVVATTYYKEQLPDFFYVKSGQDLQLQSDVVQLEKSVLEEKYQSASGLTGGYTAQAKLFGLFPIKEVKVNVMSQGKVIPCGMPFGIKMFTQGVMVVGMSDVTTASGKKCPAKLAGLKNGDIILSINGQEVNTNEEVSAIIGQCEGSAVSLHVQRDNTETTLTLQPVYDNNDKRYKGGIWVRDSSAGIGTLTFYDPTTQMFGGLGHAVCDVDTGEIMPLSSGEVVSVDITGVKKGTSGFPGELNGTFTSEVTGGVLLKNDETGVYGTMGLSKFYCEPVEIALRQEIQEGPVQILTTIQGNAPQCYEAVIEKINLSDQSMTKNMIIRITDPDLIAATGGIVQGMSGSPILQNGKLIGAVTHVFVNDPTRGYAIFAENMLSTMNEMSQIQQKNAS